MNGTCELRLTIPTYRIDLEQRDGYAVVTLAGDFVNMSETMKWWLNLGRELQAAKVGRALIIRGPGVRASDTEFCEIVGALPDVGLADVRIALIFTANPRADYTFLEAIAARRGLQLRVVPDEATAQDFLLADVPR